MRISDAEMRRARRRLREVGPKAKAEARRNFARHHASNMTPASLLGQSIVRYLSEDNLDGMHVYHDGRGWQADVILKRTPLGVPDVLGTQSAHPLPSRAQAERDGFVILVGIYEQIMENAAASHDRPPADDRIFGIEDVVIKLPGALIDQLAPVAALIGAPDHDLSRERLEEILQEIAGDAALTEAHLDAADEQQMLQLVTQATLMMLNNHFRYDRPQHAPEGAS